MVLVADTNAAASSSPQLSSATIAQVRTVYYHCRYLQHLFDIRLYSGLYLQNTTELFLNIFLQNNNHMKTGQNKNINAKEIKTVSIHIRQYENIKKQHNLYTET